MYRLSRMGNRKLDAALHQVVLTQARVVFRAMQVSAKST